MDWVLSLTSAVAVSAEHSGDHPAYCTQTNNAFHRVRGLPAWLLQQPLLLFLGYPAEHSGDHLVLYTDTLHRVRGLPMLRVSYTDTLPELINVLQGIALYNYKSYYYYTFHRVRELPM